MFLKKISFLILFIDLKEINTDVFTSDDLPLQGPSQNIILCSEENKNNNVNQASKGNYIEFQWLHKINLYCL